MCLIAKNNHCFRIAHKDIVCYKIMAVYTYNENYAKVIGCDKKYLTPYREVEIPWEVISGAEPMKSVGKCKTVRSGTECMIDSGYIHTFAEYPKQWLINIGDSHPYHVFKCIIPKGTRYVKGTFCGGGFFESYASKQIVFIEEVKG